METLIVLAAVVCGVLFGVALVLLVQRHRQDRGPRLVNHPPPPLSIAHPAPRLGRGSLAGDQRREQAWAWIARFRDALDQMATQMEGDPEVQESDALTILGLACRVCVSEVDHRNHELEEIE